jgi:hypothetical protein
VSVHRFAFDASYRVPGLLFGVTPATARVEVDAGELRVRFGPWRLRTPLDNVGDCQVTDGYSWLKTAGPAHLSLADRGVTFATSHGPGLCVAFHEPVAAIDWVGRIRHPAATLTVEDPDRLRADLEHRR